MGWNLGFPSGAMVWSGRRVRSAPICGPGSGRRLGLRGSLRLLELVKDGAVLNHGGAKLLCGGFDAAGTDRNAVGEAVVFHDSGVGDGDIGGALFEAGVGI